MQATGLIEVDLSNFPDSSLPEFDFRDTSFFCQNNSPNPQLPEPSLLRRRISDKNPPNDVVTFQDLGLVVKYGNRVRIEEALTLRMINVLLPNEVPTPEIYGWRTFEGDVYIYMALVHGATLNFSFDSLSDSEKEKITGQLSLIVSNLRRLRQGRKEPILGSLLGTQLWDLYWRDDGGRGPFRTVLEFNNKMQEDAIPRLPITERNFDDPYRGLLTDSCQIFFTHADIHSHNIMVAGPPGARQIAAIIDWEQAGWYPEYWEYCKMIGCENYEKGWLADGWVDKVMAPYKDELNAWGTYMLWRAP